MSRQILKGILFLALVLTLGEVFVHGAAISQQTADYNCAFCELLKTLVSKQNAMDKKMDDISQQNRNLERKIDLLLGTQANCSTGRTRVVIYMNFISVGKQQYDDHRNNRIHMNRVSWRCAS